MDSYSIANIPKSGCFMSWLEEVAVFFQRVQYSNQKLQWFLYNEGRGLKLLNHETLYFSTNPPTPIGSLGHFCVAIKIYVYTTSFFSIFASLSHWSHKPLNFQFSDPWVDMANHKLSHEPGPKANI